MLYIRCRKGGAIRGAARRLVGELLTRVHRAGQRGQIVLRADSGFENHKLIRTREGAEFSIGVKQSEQVRALIAEIPEKN